MFCHICFVGEEEDFCLGLFDDPGDEDGAQSRKICLLALNIMQGEFLLVLNSFCILFFQEILRWTCPCPGTWDWCRLMLHVNSRACKERSVSVFFLNCLFQILNSNFSTFSVFSVLTFSKQRMQTHLLFLVSNKFWFRNRIFWGW